MYDHALSMKMMSDADQNQTRIEAVEAVGFQRQEMMLAQENAQSAINKLEETRKRELAELNAINDAVVRARAQEVSEIHKMQLQNSNMQSNAQHELMAIQNQMSQSKAEAAKAGEVNL